MNHQKYGRKSFDVVPVLPKGFQFRRCLASQLLLLGLLAWHRRLEIIIPLIENAIHGSTIWMDVVVVLADYNNQPIDCVFRGK
jgi:hypothetical protein